MPRDQSFPGKSRAGNEKIQEDYAVKFPGTFPGALQSMSDYHVNAHLCTLPLKLPEKEDFSQEFPGKLNRFTCHPQTQS